MPFGNQLLVRLMRDGYINMRPVKIHKRWYVYAEKAGQVYRFRVNRVKD